MIPVEKSSLEIQTKKEKPKTTGGSKKVAISPKVTPTSKAKKKKETTSGKGKKEILTARKLASTDLENANSSSDADATKVSLLLIITFLCLTFPKY